MSDLEFELNGLEKVLDVTKMAEPFELNHLADSLVFWTGRWWQPELIVVTEKQAEQMTFGGKRWRTFRGIRLAVVAS